MTGALRFGLVGTGHWAQITHAPALASTDGIDFAAVWGRNSGAAAELADRYHATPYHDVSEFVANVDAICGGKRGRVRDLRPVPGTNQAESQRPGHPVPLGPLLGWLL